MARALALALLCLLAACASEPARQSYAPERSSYPAPGAPVDPWGPYIDEASQRFGVPGAWIRAVMQQESRGHEYLDGQPITSSAGAMGLMQLMPDTYADMQSQYDLGGDPYDPHDNILAGTAYIRQMYNKYGSPGFLAAYNAGPARVDDYLAGQGALPAETENYVTSIAPHLSDAAPGSPPIEVAAARPASTRPDGCWHDPDAAYDPAAPCQSRPVIDALPTGPAVQTASYAPAATAIGHFDPLPRPTGMAAPIERAVYLPPPTRILSGHWSGHWSVQVGAFGQSEEARLAVELAQRAAPSLASAREVVTTTGGLGGQLLYRARLAGLDRAGAASACETLRAQAIDCILVATGG